MLVVMMTAWPVFEGVLLAAVRALGISLVRHPAAGLAILLLATTVAGGEEVPSSAAIHAKRIHVARPISPALPFDGVATPSPEDLKSRPGEHPLMPAIRWARQRLESLRLIRDYSCTFVKRERVDGELGEHEFVRMKVRNEPFSVYLYYLRPQDKRGQEVLYVDGRNEGKLWAHSNGMRDRVMGTVSLEPQGPFAMRGNRYPLTEIGMVNLVERLIGVAEADAKYGECEVRTYSGAKINGRRCLCLEVEHPRPRQNFRFHIARIYIDHQLNLPVRYESYTWPRIPGGKPMLIEEYTYLNVRLNHGYDDTDFDTRNPEYDFPREVLSTDEVAHPRQSHLIMRGFR